ncbi:RNA-binding transcriptional accessory protein [Prevotella sp. A2931]|uniref:RNA-binding transcriptional accessory protein n=1 Tax=Prevotella illustrans TaxID=2800387 RepID=A0ABS3M7R4_9BACT|nr:MULTISPECIES: Tex family protein [Prevotella]MBO1364213.1 RNA-binding transcriptional accessory protein [Prevotella illustrans]PTL25385.1 RNA-binding transcriptional accessory protein [Prevotella sp. oral taxon 820]
MNIFTNMIARQLQLADRQVDNTLQLLDEGCTIPFVARYRKERTGSLDEVQIQQISELHDRLKDIAKRKETVVKTITEQGKMTADLRQRIDNCWDATDLEDIYLPFKPKRRTKAQIAREQGLEPLATILMMQREQNPFKQAERFVKGEVKDTEAAIKGAQDIIAEMMSEDEQTRQQVRSAFKRSAVITSKAVKAKSQGDEAQKYSDYFDFSEPLKRCTGHRLLAMRRGENEGFLRISIDIDEEDSTNRIKRRYVHGFGKCQQLVGEAVDDAFKRLVKPSIETEFSNSSKEAADDEAIHVFTENLRQLLLAAPLGQKRVMGVDPGIRTGCKVVCLDAQGELLFHTVVFAVGDKVKGDALNKFIEIVRKFNVEAIAVGNGTAGRETTDILRQIKEIPTYVVSEDGASIYSASKIAREEFPNEDVTVRGAVSIGRRLMDPLAELVKIDPKSIGVGQYQHDVNQAKLKRSLDMTVESCVNQVGVNLNTASSHLLTYVSGLGPTLARNIVDYRRENGAFTSRAQLKKVPRLGNVAYQQCAGFLRLPNAKNPLDNSAVHPESYHIVEQMAKGCGCSVAELIQDKQKQKAIDIKRYVTADVGIPTLTDIMQELEKPGRDPREQLEEFAFDEHVHTVDDLIEGMELPGIVTNITNFGAFVDIGVHQDGLVHISQLANRFVSDPNEVVKLHQHVFVRVVEVDRQRRRIALSMKQVNL